MNDRQNQASIFRNRRYYQHRLECILRYVNPKDTTILDMGCGEQLLKTLLEGRNVQYLGVDHFPYPGNPDMLVKDLMESTELLNQYQQLWLIGVVDHMVPVQKSALLDQMNGRLQDVCIITQRQVHHPMNCILATTETVHVESFFPERIIEKLYFLKWPGSQRLHDLTHSSGFCKKLATEVVYIIRNQWSIKSSTISNNTF